MGGAVSAGNTNDELIDNLIEADYIKEKIVERVFRAVDRADYYLEEDRDNAYKDLAWKRDKIHLSAPCIYAEVMESLQLKSHLSFLNLGSGTGYLSTLVGLILGPYGTNHGMELHQEVVDYAVERLDKFLKSNERFDEFEFCVPKFCQGNCLSIAPGGMLYDRIYCGAACPPEYENYFKNLIQVGGILVMPLNDQLLQITRISETEWVTKSVLPVSFALLQDPSKEDAGLISELPEMTMLTLQEICRVAVRRSLRQIIETEHPELKPPPGNQATCTKQSLVTKPRRRKRRQVNIVPMGMGLMEMTRRGRCDSESDSDDSCIFPNYLMGVSYGNDCEERSGLDVGDIDMKESDVSTVEQNEQQPRQMDYESDDSDKEEPEENTNMKKDDMEKDKDKSVDDNECAEDEKNDCSLASSIQEMPKDSFSDDDNDDDDDHDDDDVDKGKGDVNLSENSDMTCHRDLSNISEELEMQNGLGKETDSSEDESALPEITDSNNEKMLADTFSCATNEDIENRERNSDDEGKDSENEAPLKKESSDEPLSNERSNIAACRLADIFLGDMKGMYRTRRKSNASGDSDSETENRSVPMRESSNYLYGNYMNEKITALPLPPAIKQYLMFFRKKQDSV